jgi:outer membrane protein with beta-barrel domain
MKKLILALLATGTIATANAQEPHSVLLYGNAGFVSNSYDSTVGSQYGHTDKTTNWNAKIGVGYQFNHNWTLGLQVMWGQDAYKNYTGDKNTLNTYAVGPFVRYSHYIRKSETFFWYSQADFDYIGGYHTHMNAPADIKHTGVFVDLYPALGINVGRGLCLNFSIGGISYSTDKYADHVYANNTFSFDFGQQVNVGISKNFNCGHKMHSHHEPGDEVHRRKADKMEDEDDAAPKPKKKERNRDDDE